MTEREFIIAEMKLILADQRKLVRALVKAGDEFMDTEQRLFADLQRRFDECSCKVAVLDAARIQ